MRHPPPVSTSVVARLALAGLVLAGLSAAPAAATEPSGDRAPRAQEVVTPKFQSIMVGDIAQPAISLARTTSVVVLTDRVTTEPFTAAGVTWDVADLGTDVTVELRLRERGTWSEWVALDIEIGIPDESTPEGRVTSGTVGSEPLLTDGADAVQARLTSDTALDVSAITLSLVDGGTSTGDEHMYTTAATGAPPIITRAQWGADESLRSGGSSLNTTVKAMFVHHTASSNSYTSGDTAAQIRSIYAYHTRTLGWSDIGYNFLVDKFGRAYEGRAGSITQPVQGAHTGGFNTDSMGVSALGNYETVAAPSAMVDIIGRVAGWKLGQYSQPVDANVTLTSAGGGTSRYPAGTKVTLRAISGHRDTGSTACPGQYLYSKLPTIRSIAETVVPSPPPLPPPVAAPTPVTADVDGDGRSDVGWFRDGDWAFMTATGSVVTFRFGRAGDVPVVGDFAQSGRDGIGVFRGGAWHLRWTASAGPAQASFSYGQAGDTPVVGHWPDASRDAVGIKRSNRWHLRDAPSAGPARWAFSFGLASDRPTTGDWNGAGNDLPGLLRAGRWHLAGSTSDLTTRWSFAFGKSTDRPVAGDWDGDGQTGPGVVRGTTFLGRNSLTGGAAQYSVTFAD